MRGGVYDESGILRFSAGLGTSSVVDKNGDVKIKVYKLDDVVESATFIKMDIEGSEQKALKGAKRLIERDSPKLAICIYHSLEDIWKIPQLIKEINPDYKIYIRNYTDRIDETVCYGIIEKK